MQNDVCKKKFMIFPNILKIISLQTFEHKQFFYSSSFFSFIAIMGNVTTLEHSSLQKQMKNKKAKQILSIFIGRRTKCVVQLELHDFFPIVSFQFGIFSSQFVNNI